MALIKSSACQQETHGTIRNDGTRVLGVEHWGPDVDRDKKSFGRIDMPPLPISGTQSVDRARPTFVPRSSSPSP